MQPLIKPLLATLLIAVSFLTAHAQNATAGLFVCNNADGSKNIVTAANKTEGCLPYQKGMLGGTGTGTVTTAPAATMPATPTNTAPSTTGGLFNNVQPTTGTSAHAPETAKRINLTAHTPTIPPKTTKKPAKTAEKTTDKPTTKTAEKTPDAPLPDTQPEIINIYFCGNYNGGEIVEGATPPSANCKRIGEKAKVQDPRSLATPMPNPNAAPKGGQKSPLMQGKGEVAVTESTPANIYKCFDKQGIPTYVAENQTKKFRRCTFFSRSFASAQQDFQKQATAPAKSLEELAAQGVSTTALPEPTATAALRCVGAGQVVFNGQEKQYDCATRSYDLTPGTTGGQITLGDRTANIGAHRLDYLNSGGSCGGTITTADGRLLHLSPTKDCPEAIQIEARRIEQAYVKSISVNVSGQFLERQRSLSPQINQIAAQVGVDPFLVHAIISAESAYKPRATSRVGAQGLMQLMPATARRFGVYDAYNTGENIRGGTTYLKWLLNRFNGNYQLAIAGYNAGEGNVIKYGYKIPPFIETRAYVPKVMEYYRRYKANPSLIGQ